MLPQETVMKEFVKVVKLTLLCVALCAIAEVAVLVCIAKTMQLKSSLIIAALVVVLVSPGTVPLMRDKEQVRWIPTMFGFALATLLAMLVPLVPVDSSLNRQPLAFLAPTQVLNDEERRHEPGSTDGEKCAQRFEKARIHHTVEPSVQHVAPPPPMFKRSPRSDHWKVIYENDTRSEAAVNLHLATLKDEILVLANEIGEHRVFPEELRDQIAKSVEGRNFEGNIELKQGKELLKQWLEILEKLERL